jgi:hypothetical protein
MRFVKVQKDDDMGRKGARRKTLRAPFLRQPVFRSDGLMKKETEAFF